MYNFQIPNQMPAVPAPQQTTPRIYSMEVINSPEELNYRSAPTNGNPAFFMLVNENKIFQMRWNGRTNEISAFNVFPCVEYQQNNQQVKPAEDRISVMERTINDLSAQMSSLTKALGVNNESSVGRNNEQSK